MVLPQIVGPAASGWLISGVKVVSSEQLAYVIAFGIAGVWFVLATILVGLVKMPRAAAD
jgi:hypothetical protein